MYVAHLDHGPRWQPDRSVFEQGPIMAEHLEAMRRLYRTGILVLGGPYAGRGGIAVLDLDTIDEAEETISKDPAVLDGVLIARVDHLHAYFDRYHEHETGHFDQLGR